MPQMVHSVSASAHHPALPCILLPQIAQQVLDLVRGLVGMNRKQLAAVSHLLNDEQLEHLRLAARLPITNQGRKREENLVAKLLRAEEDEATLEKLAVRPAADDCMKQ